MCLDINDRISVGHKYAESDKILSDAEWFHKFCQINVSPADGHWFIHSMATSIKTQITPFVDVDANDWIHTIFAEVSRNKENYEVFFDGNGQKLFRVRLVKYAIGKLYDSDGVDTVPLIVCNAFNFTLIVVNESEKRVFAVLPTFSTGGRLPNISMILHKVGDHYNGVTARVPEES